MTDQESRALSPAEKQRARTDALVAAVEQRSEQLTVLLEESGIPFRRFVEVFRRALIQNPDLLQADPGSVIQSCMNACTDGLLPDGRQGALVVRSVNVAPRGQRKQYVKKASWQPMVQGLLAIAYASGNFKDIQARVVYEGDAYDYALGIEPWVEHKPARRPAMADGASPRIVAAYAVARTKDGGVFFEPFEADDIRKVRAVAAATAGPWANWESEMTRKGPLRRMWKYLPKNPRMERVVEHDDENYDLDALEVPEDAAQPALKRGFVAKPAAIEHREDETVKVPMGQVRTEEPHDAFAEDDSDEPLREMASEEEGRASADEPHRGDSPVEAGRDDESEPAAEVGEESAQRPPRIQEFDQRLDACKSWLNIKQAIRSLYKAEDWERGDWERDALAWAWGRKREIEDRTDFVTDVYLFACWVCGADPAPDDVESNLAVLETQADWKKATPEIQDWARRIAGVEA